MSAQRIRVVAILDELRTAGGGAERVAMGIAAGLDPERFESSLCVTRWSEAMLGRPGAREAVDELTAAGVELIPIERRGRLDPGAWAPLRRRLREGADVVHGHMHGSNVWAAWHGRRRGVPVVIAHEQTWAFEGEPLRRLIDRRFVAPRVDAYVAVSDDDRRRLIEKQGIPAGLIRVIPNGIPAATPARSEIRGELGIGTGAPLVGAVARLHPQKSLTTLIAAAAELAGEVPGIRVVIVGEGPERGRLERAVSAAGLSGIVHLAGARTDIPGILEELDVAVLCSDYEGSPLALMEYMQAGRPIVATGVRGNTQLIRDREEGLLVAPRDPGALAAAVRLLLSDGELAARLGVHARQRQREEFSIASVTRRFEALYEELLAARTTSS